MEWQLSKVEMQLKKPFINIFLCINLPVHQVNDNKPLVKKKKHLPESAHSGPDLGTHKVWHEHTATASLCMNCDNPG